MMFRHSHYLVAAMALFLLLSGIATPTQATLKFYYDPATGNVSFDTAETRTGSLYTYGFTAPNYYQHQPNNGPMPVLFIPENQIHLSTSILYVSLTWNLSEGTLTDPWRGLYTVGNILPPGLTEEFWTTAYDFYGHNGGKYSYAYVDAISMGEPPPAEFIYGPPDGEFENRWDLVDPDALTWAQSATLIYRAWNGEVLIDTTGPNSGYISSVVLRSEGGFLPDGYTPIVDSPFNGATDRAIFQYSDALEPGIYSFGRILTTGMSREEFEATFTEAKFIGQSGFKGGSFNFEADGLEMSLQFVPEPGALLLACAALAYAIASKRRTIG